MGGISSANFSNNDLGYMIKNMGLNTAIQRFGPQYSDILSRYISGQISEEELGQALSQKVTTGVTNSVFEIIGNAITGAFNSALGAEKDVASHEQKIEAANKRAEEIAKISDEDVRACVQVIDEQTTKIQEIIEEAEKLIQQSLKEEEEQIATLQQELNKKVELLNSNTDPEKQEEILNDIEGIGAQIVETATAINTFISAAIEKSRANIQVCTKLITEEISKSVDIITQNLQAMQANQTQASVEAAKDASADTAKGTEEAAKAAAYEAKAAGETIGSAFTFGLSGVFSGTDTAKAADLMEASRTHFAGAVSNLSRLSQVVGSMSQISNEMLYDIQMVGKAGTTAAGLVGSYETVSSRTINVIGSLNQEINEAKKTFDEKVKEYRANNGIPEKKTEGSQVGNPENSNNDGTNTKGKEPVQVDNKDKKLEIEEDLFTKLKFNLGK